MTKLGGGVGVGAHYPMQYSQVTSGKETFFFLKFQSIFNCAEFITTESHIVYYLKNGRVERYEVFDYVNKKSKIQNFHPAKLRSLFNLWEGPVETFFWLGKEA